MYRGVRWNFVVRVISASGIVRTEAQKVRAMTANNSRNMKNTGIDTKMKMKERRLGNESNT